MSIIVCSTPGSTQRAYGSTATSNALGVSKAFRAFLNSTAKRGPRPGIETVAHNRWAMKKDPHSDDGDSGIRKAS